MTPLLLAAAIVALVLVLVLVASRIVRHVELDPLPDDDCAVCGRVITADRCALVQLRHDELGDYAVTATFHPQCCPIDAPDHAHAGTTVRVTSEP